MFQKITSRENQKLKNARKVRDGKIKDFIFIEGVRHSDEALRSSLKIHEVFFSENFTKNRRNNELVKILSKSANNICEVDDDIFQSIADTKTSQGIVLLIERPGITKKDFESKIKKQTGKHSLYVYLNEINNPSNLGAIFRTAEAAGVSGLIISSNSADIFSPKASRSSIGANLRLPVWENADYTEAAEWAKERKLIATAADISAVKPYTQIDWTKARLLIFGSEARGLSAQILKNAAEVVFIPMENGVESLNLAVSCGIILFEAKRQNEQKNNE